MKLTLNTPGGNLEPVAGMPSGGESMLNNVLVNSTTIILAFTVILAIFFLIFGGIQWITSGGNKEKLAGAQKKIIFAVIGLIIVLLSFMIVNIIGQLFEVDFFE